MTRETVVAWEDADEETTDDRGEYLANCEVCGGPVYSGGRDWGKSVDDRFWHTKCYYDQEGTTEIEVELPYDLLESIDATVEQSRAYADRDALVREAITTETAGFDGAVADDDADADGSIQCVLCEEESATVEAHEQHMDDIHADGERYR